MAAPYKLTVDGFETQWQTNHLGPFFLTQCLLPILSSTAAVSPSKSRVRIVNVAGDAALLTAPKEMDLAHPNLENIKGKSAGWKRYDHSKQASIIHACALHDRLHAQGISAFAVHPGTVDTNLQAGDPSFFGSVVKRTVEWGMVPGGVISVQDGASNTLFCATSEEAVKDSGGFFVPFAKLDRRVEKWTKDREFVRRLWDESERMVREAGF